MDPLGAVERLEFHWDTGPVPATAAPGDVPPGFENRNVDLNMIMSLHWAKGRDVANVQEATASRWLLQSLDWMWDPGWTVSVPHTVQRPGEARTWYVYTGATARPSQIARRLPDGSVYSVQSTYNYQDNVTWTRDPVGREKTFTYAANGIDLLQVRNTTGGGNHLLATYSNYTAGHLPQTMTDAAGQTTQVAYNSFGQRLTVTNAKQETTGYTYDPNGYLQTVTGPISGATVTYGYDPYGRARSVTPAGEAIVATNYDALNRPTRTTYPDGSYDESTYDRLDVATRRDRRGRMTSMTYNARRQIVATRDPAGRVIQQQWCGCGALEALVDANGNATRWERDTAGRVLREVRADGVTATNYTYDALGRVKTITDPKNQVITYTYTMDGAVAAMAFSNAQIATPAVTWTYDTGYRRVKTMVDGTGTTTFSYHPVGQLGARRVATVDGPLANDVISYTYDELGRAVTRAVAGVPLTLTYDSIGRIEREINALGTFDYTFDGASIRPATVTYPNNQTSTYLYSSAEQGRHLQTIHHQHPDGTTLSRFDYTYDGVGNILTWRQQAEAAAVMWEYGYDGAEQLVRATQRATDPQGSIMQRFAYGYDAGGNRQFEQVNDSVSAWTYDRLNRVVTQHAGGFLGVAGTVNEPATVTVDGRPASVNAEGLFVGAVRMAPGTTRFTVAATDASGNTVSRQYDMDQVGAAKAFTFDANGNMTSDGTRTFEWDARNQLAAIVEGSTRREFTYDGGQRRVRTVKRVSGVVQEDIRFVWCDSAPCEERNGTGSTTTRRAFSRGEQLGTTNRFFTHDHIGSVREVSSSSAAVLARFEFDPSGRRTATISEASTTVGFTGFATSDDIGLYFAMYRTYDPALGRWLSEDPLGLAAGPNLHAYANGEPCQSPRSTWARRAGCPGGFKGYLERRRVGRLAWLPDGTRRTDRRGKIWASRAHQRSGGRLPALPMVLPHDRGFWR